MIWSEKGVKAKPVGCAMGATQTGGANVNVKPLAGKTVLLKLIKSVLNAPAVEADQLVVVVLLTKSVTTLPFNPTPTVNAVAGTVG